ncbi:hypothetical protein ACO0QE_000953 [Hanseniaspora vineae]
MSKIEQLISCPVCNKEIKFSRINAHLDNCSMAPATAGTSNSSGNKRSSTNSSITNFFQPTLTNKKPKLEPVTRSAKSFVVGDLEMGDEPNNTEDLVEIIPTVDATDPASSNQASGLVQNNRKPEVMPLDQNRCGEKYYAKIRHLPLSEKVRPQTLSDYVGQDHLLNPGNGILYRYIQNQSIPSMLLWGPPGVGKTTLARLLVKTTNATAQKKSSHQVRYKLVEISATKASVSDMKKIFENSKKDYHLTKYVTVLFIDEIHRFNKTQQDVLLPSIENGEIILIGCTTENPSFQLNNALLSRCQVFVLKSLQNEDLRKVLMSGVRMLKHYYPTLRIAGLDGVEENQEVSRDKDGNASPVNELFDYLISICNGDTRRLLNLLEMIVTTTCGNSQAGETSEHWLQLSTVKELIKTIPSIYYYDSKSDFHYDYISALHKSIRGSDTNASLYYLARMLKNGEDPRYIARRMIRIASEDIGVVNNEMLPFAVATYEAVMKVGMPECELNLAHCCALLCESPKSVKLYRAWNKLKQLIDDNEYDMGNAQIPMHLRNAPTKLMADLGYHKGYQYNPDFKNGVVDQEYWPQEVLKRVRDEAGSKSAKLNIYEGMEHLG